jgi:hypothetical protein
LCVDKQKPNDWLDLLYYLNPSVTHTGMRDSTTPSACSAAAAKDSHCFATRNAKLVCSHNSIDIKRRTRAYDKDERTDQ